MSGINRGPGAQLATPIRVHLHGEDQGYRVVSARNVLCVAWHDAPTLAQMRVVGAASSELRRRFPRGMALMNVIVGSSARFSKEVREEAIRQTRESGDHCVGVAHVILSGGLPGSTTRAFLSTMILLGRPEAPTKVFGSVEDASLWVATQLMPVEMGSRWDPERLGDIVREAIGR